MATPAGQLSRFPVPQDEPQLLTLAALRDAWVADATSRHEAHQGAAPRGPRIAFPKLEKVLGGPWPQGVNMIHGQPGIGKTSFALQAAAETSCPSLYVSSEMAALELVRRLVSRTTSTYLDRLRTGELSPETAERLLATAIERVPYLAFADATLAPAEVSWIQRAAEQIRGDSPHLMLVIDSIHSWTQGLGGVMTEYEALNEGIAALRRLSNVLECSVLAIVERNRVSMKQGGLSAGAGTRKIEYSADTVLDLSAEDPDFDANGEMHVTLKVAKNRNGTAGAVAMKWHGATQRFREW